eukprot:SAG31_NODE_975_length_10623_cov_7.244964_4_plen_149_part_00
MHNCGALAPDPANVTPGWPAGPDCIWNGTLGALAFAKTKSSVPCTATDGCAATSVSCCPQNHEVFEVLASYLPGTIPWDWGGKYIVNKCGVPVLAKLVPNFQPFTGGNCSRGRGAHGQTCAANVCCNNTGHGFRPTIDKLMAESDVGC